LWKFKLLELCFLLTVLSCQAKISDAPKPIDQVFVDATGKTLYVFAPDHGNVPVIPGERQKKLLPALYCSNCQKWHPVPPPDVMARNPEARLCGKTKAVLSPVGPIPDSAVRLQAK